MLSREYASENSVDPNQTSKEQGKQQVQSLIKMLQKPEILGTTSPCPEFIKLLSCSTKLSMKFPLQINMKMPTLVGIFMFISREIFMLSYV